VSAAATVIGGSVAGGSVTAAAAAVVVGAFVVAAGSTVVLAGTGSTVVVVVSAIDAAVSEEESPSLPPHAARTKAPTAARPNIERRVRIAGLLQTTPADTEHLERRTKRSLHSEGGGRSPEHRVELDGIDVATAQHECAALATG
jgi:hypothetical protein